MATIEQLREIGIEVSGVPDYMPAPINIKVMITIYHGNPDITLEHNVFRIKYKAKAAAFIDEILMTHRQAKDNDQ